VRGAVPRCSLADGLATGAGKALGVWGAISGLAAAAGVFIGGVLSQGPG